MASTEPAVEIKSALEYCSHMMDVQLATHLPVIPAICIILILSSLEKRRFRRDMCNGWFGFVVPMNFLDGYTNRWSYVAAFVAAASFLLKTLGRVFMIKAGVWAKVFLIYLQGLEVALQLFPLFACIGTRFRLVGSICGTLYILVTAGISSTEYIQSLCGAQMTIKYNNAAMIVGTVIAILPEILAYLFLLSRLVTTLVKCIMSGKYIQDESIPNESHNKTHIKLLLRTLPGDTSEDTGWRFWRYRPRPGYKYPTYIMCSTIFMIVFLWMAIIQLHVAVMPYVHMFREEIDTVSLCNNELCMPSQSLLLFLIDVFIVSTYLTSGISMIVVITNVLMFLRCYRLHIFKLFKGDKSFIITKPLPTHRYMAQSIRFPGYFISYNIWGFAIVYIVLLILFLIDGIAVKLLSVSGKVDRLFLLMLEYMVYPLSTIALFKGQVFLAKHFLLQKRVHATDPHPPLSVDNRKFYNVLSYYLLFVNIAVGFVSSLARTATSFILALFQIGRLDKNLFLSGWHAKDRGYAAYIAMLHVEYSHNHPVMRVFCSQLWEKVQEQRDMPHRVISPGVYANIGNIAEHDHYVNSGDNNRRHVYVNTMRDRRDPAKQRIHNRWLLLYTLLRNPTLTSLRRPHPPLPERSHAPEVDNLQRPSLKSVCQRAAPVAIYKTAIASPLIIIAILVGIPFLTVNVFW